MRLGSISFINSLPVDLGILSHEVPCDAEIVRGTPSRLNLKIEQGALEVSPVSAFWYAQHQSSLVLLPDFSISSKSGVQSVLLFSKKPLSELKGSRIALNWKGRTTPALLEVICRLRYGFFPEFLPMIEAPLDLVLKAADASLLIGDEALLERDGMQDDSLFVTDLAQEWKEWTGLPIVFAVWAVRRAFLQRQSAKVTAIYKSLVQSRNWGATHPERVIDEAERLSELPPKLLHSYFSGLSYDFGEDLQKGFTLFLNYAAECELLDNVRPLEFIDGQKTASSISVLRGHS